MTLAAWTGRVAAAIALALAMTLVAAPAAHARSGADGDASAPPPVSTATISSAFDPGLIISDSNFFNYQSMTAAGIQGFLEDVPCVPREGVPCLSRYRQDTTTQPDAGPGHCSRYRGASNESAGRIIWRVAQACRISPRVLLVLLQKEQSLLTRPSASGYLHATGYGCPDSAECDRAYFGFFNQVYNAAWQFRQYTVDRQWHYRIGRIAIPYHPDQACGSSVVRIRNQATANLYNYTPYQPNRAAIAALGSERPACGSYGNLNFFRIYSDWFGNPRSVVFGPWWPACLDFVDGKDCAFPSPLQLGG
ncbi:MAG: hypothetical protein ABI255_02315 [Microbacteriaceae bacterium]